MVSASLVSIETPKECDFSSSSTGDDEEGTASPNGASFWISSQLSESRRKSDVCLISGVISLDICSIKLSRSSFTALFVCGDFLFSLGLFKDAVDER